MSQVLLSAGRQSTFGPHIADVVPALGGRLAARAHGGRDDLFLHRQQALRTDSAMTSTTPQDTPTVFVIDDDVSVRESLKLLISFAGWRPEMFASAQEFLARPRSLAPSCLVLEVSLPDLNGLEVQERVAAERVEMPVIFITGNGDIPMTVKAMKAGALEFMTKPFDEEELMSAIRSGLEQSHAALAQNAKIQALRTRYASLTFREREVMALVVSGLLNKQIGLKLGISEITVKAHRGKVMQKMQADSLADLVKAAERLRPTPPVRMRAVVEAANNAEGVR